MVDGFMLFCRFAAATPFFVLVAAIAMLLVAGFDEGFKPCPNFRMVSSKCSNSRSKYTCNVYVKYDTFCGQSMHPRVTTCCRVPCLQNFTTYFDANGNSDDCYSQTFVGMSVAIGGFALLGVSLFWLFALWGMCKLWPQYCTFNYLVHGINYRAAAVAGTTPVTVDDPPSRVEEVQIV